jgi:1,4-alpha-glucan branching enzyme
VGVPCKGIYTEILNSDNVEFGGHGTINEKPLLSIPREQDNQEYSLHFTLPPLSTIIFKFDYVEKTKTQK